MQTTLRSCLIEVDTAVSKMHEAMHSCSEQNQQSKNGKCYIFFILLRLRIYYLFIYFSLLSIVKNSTWWRWRKAAPKELPGNIRATSKRLGVENEGDSRQWTSPSYHRLISFSSLTSSPDHPHIRPCNPKVEFSSATPSMSPTYERYLKSEKPTVSFPSPSSIHHNHRR